MTWAFGQTCSVPFNIKFEKKTTSTVDLSWSDTNTGPQGWEIEIVKRGDIRTGMPSFPLITEKKFKLTSLIPSTAYELYIRTVCNTSRSNWNVAIPFTTTLEIPTACQINIPLKDNGIETLILDIPQINKPNLILGKNIFLESVSVVVEHDWPADLRLVLESPQGQQLVLSNHKGTVTDDFGNINDLACQQLTTFSPEACYALSDAKPPFLGVFRPDGDIRAWKLDTLSRGTWKLISFDRAIKDAGTLKFLDIKFTTEDCQVPDNFTILNTGTNEVTIGWEPKQPCNTIRIQILENGMPKDTIFVPCKEGKFTVNGLVPNTSYSFSIVNICTFQNQSQVSCEVKTSTACEPVSIAESFDKPPVCSEDCGSSCSFFSESWFNINQDYGLDWIIWQGKTNTENTGPDSDINGNGKYIYIESNPQLCGADKRIVLESRCFKILSNPSGCDMSFYYHMNGKDIGSLTLEISLDGGNLWKPLFEKTGDQGNQWHRITLSLKEYHDKIAKFRFLATTGAGAFGDIALDQIEFYKSMPVSGLNRYYIDLDGDGFGNDEFFVDLCTSDVPSGYIEKGGDCKDDNPLIFPGTTEIQCNAIDENCNGNEDDQPEANPIKLQANQNPSSCNGSSDGSIFLNLSGGNAPYTVSWNNGMQGESITGLTNGIYYATVTDKGGCILKSPFYEINSGTNLNIEISELVKPTCMGISNGGIDIIHNVDNPPYTYLWSNGSTNRNVTGIGEGYYTVTVTDVNKCFKVLEKIKLSASPSLVTNIKSVTHPKCDGQQTGSIELITVNGVSPYTYKWSTGNTTVSMSNLFAGNYTCTITDSRGCFTTFETKLVSPPPIEINIVSTEDARCYGEENGAIKTEVKGGKPGYSYLWSKQSERTDDIYNLAAGTYTLTVSDVNGCQNVSEQIVINEPLPFLVRLDSLSPATCIRGNNGYVSILAAGGNGSYNYVWKHTLESTRILDSIQSGNYSVTAYDILGCKSGIPNIFVPYINKQLELPLNLVADNVCFQDKKAIISAQVNEGKPPYDYNWSHGLQYFKEQNQDTVFSLPAGRYTLTITDVDGCVGTSDEVEIKEKQPYNFSVIDLIDNLCAEDSNGAISIVVNGGQAPISVLWNNGLYSGLEISGLASGTYKALILDQNQCKIETTPILVTSLSDMRFSDEITHTPLGSSKGKICVNISGGVSPYTYTWSNGMTTFPCIENLTEGTYKLTVTDALECMKTQEYKIESTSNTDNEGIKKPKVYPNPFVDKIYIEHLSEMNSISIFRTDGTLVKKVYRSDFSSQDILDLQGLSIGVYILESESNGLKFKHKVIKIE
jgi:subtilisin-like proprotein convertase family protein